LPVPVAAEGAAKRRWIFADRANELRIIILQPVNRVSAAAPDAAGQSNANRRSTGHDDHVIAPDNSPDVILKGALDRDIFDERLREIPATPAIMIQVNQRNFRFLPA